VGQPLTLTGGDNGMTSYSWIGPSAYADGTQNPTVSAAATTAMSGVYTLTVNDGTCTNTATTTVTVNTLPVATAANNGPICEGESLVLTGGSNGMTTYSWTGPNTFTDATQSPTVSLTATTAMDGVYTLTVNDGTCTNTATTTAVVNAQPSLDMSGVTLTDPSICGATDGSITGITGSGTSALSYSWNGGASQGSEDLTNVGAGSYTLVITDGNGCTNSEGPLSLSDPNPPAQPITVLAPGPICDGGSFTIDISSPDVTATYTWTGPNGYTNTGTTITITNITSSNSGNYTVIPTVAGCTGSSSAPINVTVNALPIVDIAAPLTIDCNNLSITLDGSNSSMGADITYDWSTSNGNITGVTNQNTTTTDTPGDYTLTLENTTTGCIANNMVTVTIDTLSPSAIIAVPNSINCNNPSVTLDGSGSTGNGLTYAWSNSGVTATTTVSSAGTYTLQVSGVNGCTSSTSVVIISEPDPIAGFTAAPISGNAPLNVVFTDNSIGNNLIYNWDFGDGTTSNSQNPSNTFYVFGATTVYLIVEDQNGCLDTASVVVNVDGESVLIIPNVFTPNEDNDNDLFYIGKDYITQITGAVYNRWGQVMFNWSGKNIGWDGRTASGMIVPEGTYYYIAEYETIDKKTGTASGFLLLVR
jgi:gliding motility-associated-like protein